MASPRYSPTYSPTYSTNERTNGLTKKVLTSRGDIALADAREEHEIHPCICTDERETCPDNCFLRWF